MGFRVSDLRIGVGGLPARAHGRRTGTLGGANVAHITQSRTDFGFGFQAKSIKRCKSFPLRSEAGRVHARV